MAEHKQGKDDLELKELLDRNRFIELLRQWTQALEGGRDFQFEVDGKRCEMPADALDRAKLEVEYEIDEGEYEIEFTMKWR